MKVQELVAQGAIFAVSHSAGKDSQAMYSLIRTLVPHDQIVVVHASLGRIEWDGVIDHILNTIVHKLEIATPAMFSAARQPRA